MNRSRVGGVLLAVAVLVFAMMGTALMSTALIGTAGATTGSQAPCRGDVVLNFEQLGVRLLNAPGQQSFGPIPVVLEPGTYTVTAVSTDSHSGGQLTQPQEQWNIVADTGWQSPFTIDIPDDEQITVSTFGGLGIGGQVSSITLQHLGEGGVNSVTPVCVGFTRTDSPSPGGSDDVPAAPEPDDGENGDDGSSIGDPVAPDDQPDGDVDGDTDIGTPTDTDDGDDAVDIGTPADTADSSDDTDSDDGDDTAAPVPDDGDGDEPDVEVEVDGEVELTPSLARTGTTPFTNRVLGLALVLLGAGGLAVTWTGGRSVRSKRSLAS